MLWLPSQRLSQLTTWSSALKRCVCLIRFAFDVFNKIFLYSLFDVFFFFFGKTSLTLFRKQKLWYLILNLLNGPKTSTEKCRWAEVDIKTARTPRLYSYTTGCFSQGQWWPSSFYETHSSTSSINPCINASWQTTTWLNGCVHSLWMDGSYHSYYVPRSKEQDFKNTLIRITAIQIFVKGYCTQGYCAVALKS